MRHEPFGDHPGISTNQLICELLSRVDTSNSLHALLALMVGTSDELPIKRQYLMACTLHDAALMIERRPEVRDWADRLGLSPAYCEALSHVDSP